MEDECPCRRTHTRMDMVVGIPVAGDHFLIVIDRKRHKVDEVHIKVELMERGFTGEL